MKVAILITTFCRDDLVCNTINSLLKYKPSNWKIYVIDQSKYHKENKTKLYEHQDIFVKYAPFDCGLSYARNLGVKAIKEDRFDYVLLGADSIEFTEKTKGIEQLLPYFKRYDLIGLDIENRIKWEAKLDLIKNKYFELDFINTTCKTCNPNKLIIYKCDIVRNFFIAKTDLLIKSPWDENLKMREHEDFFMRLKQINTKIGYINKFKGKYTGEKYKKSSSEYARIRQTNMYQGLMYLKSKWNIDGWVNYKHIENIRKP